MDVDAGRTESAVAPPGVDRPVATDSRAARRSGGSPASSQARIAAVVFGIYLVVAAALLLFHLGRYFWFHGDDWDFLVNRDAGHIGDVLRAHNEHISVLPILAWRSMWHLFGLRSYVPYQVPVVLLHLTAAALLRTIMRRSGVDPWIATAAAAVFVLFGPGEENIIWAFQIGFTGSLAFGLAQLVLADHEGGIDRRDWFGLGAGLLGLGSSGLLPITTAVVGIVVFVRRGWRAAAFQTVPLAVLYATWWVTIGPTVIKDPYGRSATPGRVLHFVKTGIVATFEGLGGNALVAAAIGVVLAVGFAIAWRRAPRGARLAQMITPLALLGAGLLFLIVSGYGRWWVSPTAGSSSRYVHLAAAFSLPAIAVAVDALARGRRYGNIVAAVLLACLIPYGVSQFDTNPPFTSAYFKGRETLIAALGRSPYLTQVPRSTRIDSPWSTITAGWLLDARNGGDLPPLHQPAAVRDPSLALRFGFAQLDRPVGARTCTSVPRFIDVSLHRGDEIGIKVAKGNPSDGPTFFGQQITAQLLRNGLPAGLPVIYVTSTGHVFRAELGAMDVRLRPGQGTRSFAVCR